MSFSYKVNTDGLNRALRDLQDLSGARMVDVIRNEATAIVNGAIKRTKMASKSKIKKGHVTRFADPKAAITADFGRGRKTYFLKNRYPNTLWASIKSRLDKSLAEKLSHVGMARRSIYGPAVAFGLRPSAPSAVTGLAAAAREFAERGSFVRESEDRNKYYIHIANRYKLGDKANVDLALAKAFNARVSYFKKNLNDAMRGHLVRWSKKYPGIFVR